MFIFLAISVNKKFLIVNVFYATVVKLKLQSIKSFWKALF